MCIRLLSASRARGLSFIELLMFIIIVSVCLAGVLAAINMGAQHSSDPMVRKQALAAAESLLEEIELQPLTYCDPRDASASVATSSAGCSAASFSMDNTANWGSGKSRYGPPAQPDFFNNVDDIFQQASSSLAGFSASVKVTQVGTGFGLASTDVLRIDVTVTGSGNTVALTGFRFRHSPNLTN
jgi:MSHA pilin protein MshD